MSGITLIYQQEQINATVINRLEAVVEKQQEVKVLVKKDHFLLLLKSNESYPYTLLEQKEYTLIVEGKIYNIDIATDPIFKTKIERLLGRQNRESDLAYFRKLDGEFIIYILNKSTKELIVLNDFLGRLPVYYTENELFIIGRDIGLIQKLKGNPAFDRQAVYEFMRLGFPLGEKTLFKNLFRLPPSSFITLNDVIRMQNQPVSLEEIHGAKRADKSTLEELYWIFSEAVKNRLNAFQNPMLSLSGGLDSRIIMGEIEKRGRAVAYESFLYKNVIIETDIEVVKRLSDFYKKDVAITALKEWAPEHFKELIQAKYGMNYLGMAFIIPFLKNMSSKYDVMLTGDGGDKTLAFLFPEKHWFVNNMSDQILKNNAILTKEGCDNVFTYNTADYEDALKTQLNAYGYKNQALNYKHFLIFERAKNWLFEGEDRNRQYIWSTSPFYHPEFFKLVHSFSENDKKQFNLYRSFTDLVNAALNNITNANWGFAINQSDKLKQLLLLQKIKQYLKLILNRWDYSNHQAPEIVLHALKDVSVKGYEGFNENNDFSRLSLETLFHMLTIQKLDAIMKEEFRNFTNSPF